MVLLISVGVFISLLVILLLLSKLVAEDQESVERLKHLVDALQNMSGESPGRERNTPKGVRGVLRKASLILGSPRWVRDLDFRLQQAAISLTGAEFMVICLSLGFLGFLVGNIGGRGN